MSHWHREGVDLHQQLFNIFEKGGFLLRKWNSNNREVLDHINPTLRDAQSTHHIPSPNEYTKTLGVEWNANLDHFRLTVSFLQNDVVMTKRALVSDIAKTFDVLG